MPKKPTRMESIVLAGRLGARGEGDAEGEGDGTGDGRLAVGEGDGEGDAAGVGVADGRGDGTATGDGEAEGIGLGVLPAGWTPPPTLMGVGREGSSSTIVWQPQAVITAKPTSAWETFMDPSLEMTLETGTQLGLLSTLFLYATRASGWPASCS